MKLRFALVSEGFSERGLVDHIEAMCVEAGAAEASGTLPAFDRLPRRPGKTVKGQIEAALALEPDIDVVFIHRDADSADSTARTREIEAVVASMSMTPRSVPVVPVQELEAWLLVDEAEIRAVAGRPSGRVELRLPKIKQIESTSSPKEVLEEALLLASETTGRRRRAVRRSFPAHRASLLERLDRRGPVRQLASWRDLEDRVRSLVGELLISEQGGEST